MQNPVINQNDLTLTLDEDVVTTTTISATDPDNGSITSYSVGIQAQNGTVVFSNHIPGEYTYTPDANYNGTDSFVVTVTDDNNGTTSQLINIMVNSINDAPVIDRPGSDNTPVTLEDTAVSGSIIASDVEGDDLTYLIANGDGPDNGTVIVDATTGVYNYIPDPDYNNDGIGANRDRFFVTVEDGLGGSDRVAVNVTVDSVNDGAPVIDEAASDIALTTNEDTRFNGAIVATDVDMGGVLAYSIEAGEGPTNGRVNLNAADGTYRYIPDGDYNGTDAFTVTVTDEDGATDTVLVNVTVEPVNDDPIVDIAASDNAPETDEDASVIGTIVATDVDGDALTYSVATGDAPVNGTVIINPSTGLYAYTPDPDYNNDGIGANRDRFFVTVEDGLGGIDRVAVNVTVNSLNDAPVFDPASDLNPMTDEDTNVTGTVVATDVDVEPVTYSVATGDEPTNGVLVGFPGGNGVGMNSGNYEYMPNADFTGTDTFTVTADDGNGGVTTQVVTVTVGSTQDAPVIDVAASDNTPMTDEDAAVMGTIVASDADGDVLTYSVEEDDQPANGSVTIDATGVYTYIPDADYNNDGTGANRDSFFVTVDDGNGNTDRVAVRVTVDPLNDAPVIDAAASDTTGSVVESGDIAGVLEAGPDGSYSADALATPAIDADIDTLLGAANAPQSAFDTAFGNVQAALGGDVEQTFAVMWDRLDDAYVGAAPAQVEVINEAFVRLGIEYASYLEDGGEPFLEVRAKFGATRDQSMHDNLLGNLNEGSLDSRFSGATKADLEGRIEAVNEDLLVRPIYSGNAGDPDLAAARAFDEGAGYAPIASGSIVFSDADTGDTVPDTPETTVSTAEADVVASYTPAGGAPGALPFALDDMAIRDAFSITTDGDWTYDTTGIDIDMLAEGDVITLTYTVVVEDDALETDSVDVTITLTGTNDAPTVAGDVGMTDEDTAVLVDVLFNDTDVDMGDDPSTFTLNSVEIISSTGLADPAVAGTVSVSGNQLSFDPGSDFDELSAGDTATVTVSYVMQDTAGALATSTAVITVNGTNDAPIVDTAVSDIMPAAIDEDSGNITGVIVADDPEGDAVTFTVLAGDEPTNGMLLGFPGGNGVGNGAGAAGQYEYQPNTDFNGTDEFTVTIADGNGGITTQVITLTVDPVNDAPVITNGSTDNETTLEDTPFEGQISATDIDLLDLDSTEALVFSIEPGDGAVNGSVDLDSETGEYTYTPDDDYNNDGLLVNRDTFTVTVTDSGGLTDTILVRFSVTPTNDDPVVDPLSDIAITTDEGAAVMGTVVATDIDGETPTYSIAPGDEPTNGTLTVRAGGNTIGASSGDYEYTPDADFNGTDTFTVTVSDGVGGTTTQVVTVTVDPVNDDPIIDNAASDNNVTTDEDVAVTGTIVAADVDGDDLTYSVEAGDEPVNGTVTFVGADYTYTPDPDYNNDGTVANRDTFTVTVSDGAGGTDTVLVRVTVDPTADDPVAVDDEGITTDEDNFVNINVLANDTDPDDVNGDTRSVTVAEVTSGLGVATIIGGGTGGGGRVRYNPGTDYNYLADGETETVEVTYTIEDAAGASAMAVATITVTGTNDGPVIDEVATGTAQSVDEDSVVPLSGTIVTDDPDMSDVLTYTVQLAPSSGTLDLDEATGAYTYTPDAEFSGDDSFLVQVADEAGLFDTVIINVTVDPTNDAPIIDEGASDLDPSGTGDGSPLNGVIVASDIDVGDTLVYSVEAADQPAKGAVLIDVAGNYSYTPTAGETGTDSFTVTVSDGNGGIDTVLVNVTLDSTNGPAVIAGDLSGAVIEDVAVNTATGTISVTDNGPNEDQLQAIAAGTAGTLGLGTFEVAATGEWTYTFDNLNPDVQALAPGENVFDEITVTSVDGTEETLSISVTGAVNQVVGTPGPDTLTGQADEDNFTGLGSNDVIIGSGGDDVIDGGDGTDAVRYSNDGTGITVDLRDTASQQISVESGSDTLISIENVFATEEVDRIIGSNENNLLAGRGDADILFGQGGNDVIFGGLGDDNINGGSNNDILTGGGGDDRINGFTGVDTVSYRAETMDIAVDLSISGFQFVSASAGSDNLIEIDNVLGGSGNDMITGDSADNILRGRDGDDVITGGLGTDRMSGGTGEDTFIFSERLEISVFAARDVIEDFEAGMDTIDFSAIDADTTSALDDAFTLVTGPLSGAAGEITVRSNGTNTFVQGNLDGGATPDFSLELSGVLALTSDDFIF